MRYYLDENGSVVPNELAVSSGLVEQYDSEVQYRDFNVVDLTDEEIAYIQNLDVSDSGNAATLIKLYGHLFKYTKDAGELVYTGKVWVKDYLATSYLFQAAKCALNIRRAIDPSLSVYVIETNRNRIENLIHYTLRDYRVATSIEKFDKQLHLLNVNNGVINLKTGELLPHSPEYYFTTLSDIDYNPDADTSKFERLMEESILDYKTDETIRTYTKKLMGYAITGDTNAELFVYSYGVKRGGKSLIISIIDSIIGDFYVSRSYKSFSPNGDPNGFALAGLYNKRLLSIAEYDNKSGISESLIKAISGQDDITVAFKGKDAFNFKPMFKTWITSNDMPNANVYDPAFWDRIRLLIFPYSKAGREDVTLKDQWKEPEMLAGALKWFVEAAMLFYSKPDRIIMPKVFQNELDKHLDKLDSVQIWINETWSEATEDICINTTDIFNAYREYTMKDQLPLGKVRFYDSLAAKGYKIVSKNIKDASKPSGYNKINCILGYQIEGVAFSRITVDLSKSLKFVLAPEEQTSK